MLNLTVVGHFSTWLFVAWVVWIAWLAGQVLWYRRLSAADAAPVEIAPRAPAPTAPVPEPKAERSGPLRAPGVALRSMTSATTTAPATQLNAETPPDGPAEPAAPTETANVAPDDVNPS
jgi:hypothetical protein